MSENAIEIKGLVKRYPASSKAIRQRIGTMSPGLILKAVKGSSDSYLTALNKVSLQVRRGEVLGLLGPNGAGKTTLIKILCTLILPDEGSAHVEGVDIQSKPSEALKKLQAILSGWSGFDHRLSGQNNLEFYATLYGLSGNEAKKTIERALEVTSLKGREHDMFQKYSTGMARRLVLCRALLRDVPVLVLDEPTSGMDPRSASSFRHLIKDQLSREQGKTILMSTHNLWEAEQMCDRIAIINHGQILACGSVEEIKGLIKGFQNIAISFLLNVPTSNVKEMINELGEVPGVEQVDPELNGNGSITGLNVKTKVGIDTSKLFYIVSTSGVRIGAVQTYNPTLEEAFLKLIGAA